VAIHLWRRPQSTLPADWLSDSILRPSNIPSTPHHDPIKWLAENSNDKHAIIDPRGRPLHPSLSSPRPPAAIITLVRNSELDGILQSIRQLDLRFNHKHLYPYIFFSESPFTPHFIAATTNLTSAPTSYELIPHSHWNPPEHISPARFLTSLSYLSHLSVGKGHLPSYHAMCRWNSGFFYAHPALSGFEFYWRIEPSVHFLCDIPYDVFRFMRDNDLKYGFNMNILDDARSFPSLWPQTREFITHNPEMLHPEADLEWLLDSTGGYNNCQFFSNFEIGSLDFFRSPGPSAYFAHLDSRGGFYYERFGDAPIHTLSTSLFLPKRQQWFFRDIGYQHDTLRHCPPNAAERCSCETTGLDEGFYKLVPMESPQRKPRDTCIRGWMGGEWVEKKEGWRGEVERAFGGDGYHGVSLRLVLGRGLWVVADDCASM
jgi:alpha 1,2-mannosyltransferase